MRDEIDREFAQVIAEMTLLSYGPVSRFDKSGGRSSEHPGGKKPSGDSNPLHHKFADDYRAATSDEERAQLVVDAREALASVLRAPEDRSEGETWEMLAERIVEKGNGWDAASVATALHVTPTQVRKARELHKRRLDDGRPTASVEALKKEGKSVREIAKLTGIAVTTVQRRIAETPRFQR